MSTVAARTAASLTTANTASKTVNVSTLTKERSCLAPNFRFRNHFTLVLPEVSPTPVEVSRFLADHHDVIYRQGFWVTGVGRKLESSPRIPGTTGQGAPRPLKKWFEKNESMALATHREGIAPGKKLRQRRGPSSRVVGYLLR